VSTMKPKSKIPKFKNEDEERAFWETRSPLDYLDKKKAKKVSLPNLKPSTEVISLRLPSGLLSDIKLVANKNDIPYQLFMQMKEVRSGNRKTGGIRSRPGPASSSP